MYKFLSILILLLNLHVYRVNAQTTPAATTPALEISTESYSIKCIWLGDTLNAKWEPYSALLIPVKLPGCPKQFYMQFDLGAPHSLFYSNKLKAIWARYPQVNIDIADTSKVTGLTFVVADQPIHAKAIGLRSLGSQAINWDRKSIEIIGTLGVDLITGRIAVIDYPERRLSIGMKIPENISKQVSLSPFMLMQGSILLPGFIRGKQTLLYFDTGSSAFELLTSKETCTALATANTVTTSYPVNSWGKTLTANTVTTSDSLQLANQRLPIKKVTYIEGASDSQIQQMMKLGIGGMIGNKLFLNAILIMDTINKKFGVICK